MRVQFEELLKDEDNVVRIDTELSLDEVTEEIKKSINDLLQRRIKSELD